MNGLLTSDILALEQVLKEKYQIDSLPTRFEPKEKFLARFLNSSSEEDRIADAAETISNHLKWRLKHNVDSFVSLKLIDLLQLSDESSLRTVASCFPIIEQGKDRDNRPVLYFLAAGLDVYRAFRLLHSNSHLIFNYLIWLRERSLLRLRLKDKDSERIGPYFTSILDLRNVRLSQANSSEFYSFLKQIIEIDSQYAGRVGKMIIVNVPSFFQFVWGVVSKLIGSGVDKKITICSAAKQNQILVDTISLEELPLDFGGTGPLLPSVASNDTIFCEMNHFEYDKALLEAQDELPPISLPIQPPGKEEQVREGTAEKHMVRKPESLGGSSGSRRELERFRERILEATSSERSAIKNELIAAIRTVQADSLQFETDMLLVRARWRKQEYLLNSNFRDTKTMTGSSEVQLQQEIQRVVEEKDQLVRAVGFAKNYLEVQNREWIETQQKLRSKLQEIMEENAILHRAVQKAFGKKPGGEF